MCSSPKMFSLSLAFDAAVLFSKQSCRAFHPRVPSPATLVWASLVDTECVMSCAHVQVHECCVVSCDFNLDAVRSASCVKQARRSSTCRSQRLVHGVRDQPATKALTTSIPSLLSRRELRQQKTQPSASPENTRIQINRKGLKPAQ